jgi:peroxiredoxin
VSEPHQPAPAIALPPDSPLAAIHKPTLVILLRSFGCTFCREAMADVAAIKTSIRAAGAEVAFVHSESTAEADPWFAKYGLTDVLHISDPTLEYYRAFGLGRTKATSIVDPHVWTRGAASALAHGFGVQNTEMMRRQPGVFLINAGRVLAEYRHRTPADRPDYLSLVRSAAQTPVQ